MKALKNSDQLKPITENPWLVLRRYTDARIGQGRAGVSLPTKALLDFQMDHASARDAVHVSLRTERLTEQLETAGFETLILHSRAIDRAEYLQRPDYGRRLNQRSVDQLQGYRKKHPQEVDVALVIADGLSSTAIQSHAVKMTRAILSRLADQGLSIAPVSVVSQGRVAVGDEVGEILGAKLLVLLVGERPGLSSPDSLGIYYTYQPCVGLTDAYRNCISNVRPAGMSIDAATDKLLWLIDKSIQLQCSGVALKDQSESPSLAITSKNLLLP